VNSTSGRARWRPGGTSYSRSRPRACAAATAWGAVADAELAEQAALEALDRLDGDAERAGGLLHRVAAVDRRRDLALAGVSASAERRSLATWPRQVHQGPQVGGMDQGAAAADQLDHRDQLLRRPGRRHHGVGFVPSSTAF
jgi:hypothetical protein